MNDTILLLVIAVIICAALLGFIILFFGKKKSVPVENEPEPQRARGVPVLRGEGVEAPRRAGRNVRARMRAAATRQVEEEDDYDPLADEITLPEGKIGAKKRKKLEMKVEKRKERERELEEREERKQRQVELEERRKREDLKEKEAERLREEEEKALKEEQARKELEEYLALKASFEVEEEGFDQDENTDEANKFQEFISYIKNQKVVLLDDLASHFRLKTQDAIDRVQELLAQEWLVGVIDERGKFIYITKEELESVAQFIKQRGRVSISELVECSNSLINLQPDMAEPLAVAS